MKKVLLSLCSLMLCALPVMAQGFGTVGQGPLVGVNCPGAPLIGIDVVDNMLYSCGTNGLGYQLAGGAQSTLAPAGTSTVINSATALNGSTVAIQSGVTNVVKRTTVYKGYGVYSITTGTPTLSLAFQVGGVTLATCTTAATTNLAANMPFSFEFVDTTITTGTAGTDEAHCTLTAVLGTVPGAAASTYLDNNTAVTTAYNHTVANNFTVLALAAGASNAATLRYQTSTIVF